MKIVHISTSDNNGGAARAAWRLHCGLLQEGIDSKMFVRDKHSGHNSVVRYQYPKGYKKISIHLRKRYLQSAFRPYLATRPEGFETFSDDRSVLRKGFMAQLPEADLYHLHWTSGFLDLPSFLDQVDKPLVWTLHDMNAFTGGCHYNSSCEKYLASCGACPQLGSKDKNDLSYLIWKRKFEAFRKIKKRLLIRADSYWLAAEAKKSSLFSGFDIDTIHYGLETDEFKPLEKLACRKVLSIPTESKVIVFGAPGLDNPRKGFKQLNQALQILKEKFNNLFLLSFGSGTLPSGLEIPALQLGTIPDNRLLAILYNCGDVFVIPSLQEAFGQTALEALSCGIPVAGYRTGGIPDMIREGINGFLAQKTDPIDLAEKIQLILNMDNFTYNSMSMNCRKSALNEFNLKLQADRYLSVYNTLF